MYIASVACMAQNAAAPLSYKNTNRLYHTAARRYIRRKNLPELLLRRELW